ncbi:MAG: ABC transporter permease DevC [Synechococcus sp.]
MRTPISWLNLVHEKTRLLVAIAGVSFAVLLVFMNLGFLGALAKTASQLYNRMEGDIFLISPVSQDISSAKPFTIKRLYQAEGIAGVKRSMPLYVSYGQWRNPDTRINRAMFFFGVNPNDGLFQLPEFEDPQIQAMLLRTNTVLIDIYSRPEFGPMDVGTVTEVEGRRVTVGGQYALGGGFASDGTVILSDQNFFRYFPRRSIDDVDVGVLQLEEDTDAIAVRDKLRQILPPDVEVYTQAGIVERERAYWIGATSTGFIFGLGVMVSLIVGAVIVYQILYTDISDRLPEYATLKAMGFRDTYLFGIVLQEASILAGLGYTPGFVVSLGLYHLAYTATSGTLPVGMEVDRAIYVFVMVLMMCVLSGGLAMRKVMRADPAEVF